MNTIYCCFYTVIVQKQQFSCTDVVRCIKRKYSLQYVRVLWTLDIGVAIGAVPALFRIFERFVDNGCSTNSPVV